MPVNPYPAPVQETPADQAPALEGVAVRPRVGLAVEFRVYEPFRHPLPGGRRHFVIYAHREDGSRKRVGALEMCAEDAAQWVSMWADDGHGFATAQELGLPVMPETVDDQG